VTTVKGLLETAVNAGFSQFAKLLTASLTDEGIKLPSEHFGRSLDTRLISNHLEIYSCLDASETNRGPSAARFSCLVGITGISDDNKFLEGDI
jgi:hypothetical protein